VAAGGYIQVFGTGGGAIVGGATDGAPGPGIGNLVTQPVTATIGGVTAKVDYAGTAPGLVNGAMQVNLTNPGGPDAGPATGSDHGGNGGQPERHHRSGAIRIAQG
jgi:uncharacterized protein (TIGR03437 family)